VDTSNAYYKKLITSQYQMSTKFMTWLENNIQKFKDVSDVADSMCLAFDIDVAVGVQLDTLGAILGQKRRMDFQPTVGDPLLGDDDYRLLLKARIGWNHWDGTKDSLYGLWKVLFPQGRVIIEDHQDMSATITIIGDVTDMQKDFINNELIVPRPEGVLYTYTFGGRPYMSWDKDDGNNAGFDTGNWV